MPPELHAERERESARWAQVNQQIKELEGALRGALNDGKQPLAARRARLCAIGTKGAWVRAPTPYDSGGSQVEQGISKAKPA